MEYAKLGRGELLSLKNDVQKEYDLLKGKGLSLNMSRGKPAPEQIDDSDGLLTVLTSSEEAKKNGDYRNYGLLEGIPEMRALFAEIFDVPEKNVLACGNSSLNLMYDAVMRGYVFGVGEGKTPWGKQGKIKFLCPCPGYDRHFAVTEEFGFELIPVKMTPTGPDMDEVETLVRDPAVKGVWCVPKYSNPTGVTYSDETVRRLASLRPAADDFRIFWDNAYYVHPIYPERDEKLLNIFTEAHKAGNDDIFYEFSSTSKITYPGGGVSCIIASDANIAFIKKHLSIQTISYDKINQLRHVLYFKTAENLKKHMIGQASHLRPKFETVENTFTKELSGLGIAEWTHPAGGYFVSLDVLDGTAKRVHALAKDAGVTLTSPGATYPYKNDPRDRNLRIAPSYPSPEELRSAMEILCCCVRLAALEKLTENN